MRYTLANSASALVDRVGEGEDALRHLARRGDEDDHDEARLKSEHLDVADGRRRHGGRRDDGEQVGDARERLGRLAQGVVDLALRAVELDERRRGPRRRSPRSPRMRVHVVAVALVGGHPAGGRVRVGQHAELLELGEVVAHRRGGGAER